LTVSIDGGRQPTYEQYRVRGDLQTVLANCRLVGAAKRRLGAATPVLNWEFHAFPHNVDDYADVRAMAAELGMNLLSFKGTVPGADWDVGGEWYHCVEPREMACASLWALAVVNNDGGVAPCNGTFYREDDMGTLAVRPGDLGASSFRSVWNGPRFQAARGFYRQRIGSPDTREHVCFNCPQTIIHERWRRHVTAGGSRATFDVGYTTNDAWNYFWNRRPTRPGVHSPTGLPGLASTQPSGAETRRQVARRR
jgi:hypothetical protein